MLQEKLSNYTIILATQSPRRHQFFKELHIPFIVKTKEIDESYPTDLQGYNIPLYIAKKKANAFLEELKESDILITSDTLIWQEDKAIGKPKNYEDGQAILRSFSGKKHQVITAVCFTSLQKQYCLYEITDVFFKSLSEEEINYYLTHYQPFDKAGSYGIQEWIGAIGIERIEGSYNNVVGFPTHRFWEGFSKIIN
ncbi:MAG: Maf family nucleotide pyrophosphatase [Capnocytophaga sp.]|nr:Maf family nucleotide pyrophosphatase [Capnocytophaga sp.]